MSEENSEGSGGNITIKKESLWRYSTYILVAILIVGAFVFFTNKDSGVTGNVVRSGDRVNVEIGSSPVIGDSNAPVTIVEFSDFECPFCGRHSMQTYPQIFENYISTGKVKYSFKDFPLTNIHPEAVKAAEAARCVYEILGNDGFWEMHDKLYENLQSLSNSNYKAWARELGADGTAFDSCLDSGKFQDAVFDDLRQGQAVGVSGTPAFFINGILIEGACPYSTFQQAIDAELAGKSWSVTGCQFNG